MANNPRSFIETIVISTRIRLARNFASYPFPKRMDDAQAEDIVYLVGEGLKKIDDFTKYDVSKLDKLDALRLQEQYLISPALLKSKRGAAFVSSDNSISIMVNEEDHLREQYICRGFDLYKAYERVSCIDDGLATTYDFAFHDKLGVLTACPSNLGTGMRASVMMFLPGLTENGGLKKLLPSMKAQGMTVRGAFGEGTNAEGYFYQISNERTLGLTESELLGQMTRATMTVCDLEIRAREEMVKRSGVLLLDRCLRAYGTLTHCALLTYKEFLEKMSDVRLGMALDFFEVRDYAGFEDFFTAMRPATFRLSNGLQGVSEKKCDEIRAETVGVALPELVGLSRKARLKK